MNDVGRPIGDKKLPITVLLRETFVEQFREKSKGKIGQLLEDAVMFKFSNLEALGEWKQVESYMRMLTCKKCKSVFAWTLRECPNCKGKTAIISLPGEMNEEEKAIMEMFGFVEQKPKQKRKKRTACGRRKMRVPNLTRNCTLTALRKRGKTTKR